MTRSDERQLTLYGWLWCSHCHEAAWLLHQHGVVYEPKLMEQGTREGKRHAGEVYRIAGRIAGPTIVFPDGRWLQEPDENKLLDKLAEHGFVEGEAGVPA